MRESERQLGVRIPTSLYNVLQDNAKSEDKSFKQYIVEILETVKQNPSKPIPQSHEAPDNWVLTADMGDFDLIIYESKSKPMAELAKENAQQYFKYPLNVIQYKDTRQLKWKMEEVLVSAYIGNPSPDK